MSNNHFLGHFLLVPNFEMEPGQSIFMSEMTWVMFLDHIHAIRDDISGFNFSNHLNSFIWSQWWCKMILQNKAEINCGLMRMKWNSGRIMVLRMYIVEGQYPSLIMLGQAKYVLRAQNMSYKYISSWILFDSPDHSTWTANLTIKPTIKTHHMDIFELKS